MKDRDPEATDTVPASVLDALGKAPVDTIDVSVESLSDLELSEAAPQARYERVGLLGRGGMGDIHLARDHALRRHVALKVLRAHRGPGSPSVVRFVTEAQLTAQLDHPNIVPVYGLQNELQPAYAMKFIQGRTLTELIDASAAARETSGQVRADLGLDALLEHFLKLCDAVEYAHSKNVVHRDLKPDNVMIGAHGEVYLMDWGLARVRGADPTVDMEEGADLLTRAGQLMGTPLYMAPEQARGDQETLDVRADQYSLGLILYEIACGRPARTGEGIAEVLKAATSGENSPMTPLAGERLRRELVAIVSQATALSPQDRYASVAELADDLRRYRNNQPVDAAPDGVIERWQRWLSNHRQSAFLAIAGLSAMLAVGAAGTVAVGVVGAGAYTQAARAREARLAAFLATSGARADEIDRAFGTFEAQLESVGSSAAALLDNGIEEDGPVVLFPVDFTQPQTAPADTLHSASYDRLISTELPDVVLAPGVQLAAVESEIRRLTPVRHAMRRAHLLTRQEFEGVDEQRAEQIWRSNPGPIRWTTVGTRSGIYLEIPGAHWTPDDFDPRVRPWYQVGEGASRPRWGRPFQEASSGTLLLPLSVEIRTPQGQALGVASLSVSFTYLIDRYLAFEHPAVRETFLVDDRAHVIVRSGQDLDQGRPDALDEHYQTPEFPYPELALALPGGGGAVSVDDGATLVVHWPLSTSGWSYVAVVDADAAASSASGEP